MVWSREIYFLLCCLTWYLNTMCQYSMSYDRCRNRILIWNKRVKCCSMFFFCFVYLKVVYCLNVSLILAFMGILNELCKLTFTQFQFLKCYSIKRNYWIGSWWFFYDWVSIKKKNKILKSKYLSNDDCQVNGLYLPPRETSLRWWRKIKPNFSSWNYKLGRRPWSNLKELSRLIELELETLSVPFASI